MGYYAIDRSGLLPWFKTKGEKEGEESTSEAADGESHQGIKDNDQRGGGGG